MILKYLISAGMSCQVQISQIRHSGLGKACPTKFVSLALRADRTLLASFDLGAKK
jgi:hypothetical protein